MNSPQGTLDDLKTQLLQHLHADLLNVNSILKQQISSTSEFVADVTNHVSRFQGKQIRPILLLLVNRMLNEETSSSAHMLAAAVEMIHTATLVHDDVIDEADTRRHVATVHQRWNTETSVLLGDYLFSKAFHLAACTGDADACRLIGRATDRTCEGELNQSALRMNRGMTELDYFRIIRDKTGQLFGLSCLLGAKTGGGNPDQQAAAKRFGMRIGLAFQIADDVLDLTADSDNTGKDAANDLENGRTTLPMLRAFQLASEKERKELTTLLAKNSTATPKTLAGNPAIIRGVNSAVATGIQLSERAIADLQRFPESTDRQLLSAIAAFTVKRPS